MTTQGPEVKGDNISHNPTGTDELVGGSTLSTARFLLHLKQHGLTYAIVALLAEQAGILQMLVSTAGGMC
jgi:hypothetical protein